MKFMKLKIAKGTLIALGVGGFGLAFYKSINSILGRIFFLYMCVIITIPTITFCFKVLFINKLRDRTYQEKLQKKKMRMEGKSTVYNDGDYLKIKALFANLMSNKQLSRADILLFKKEINRHLGSHAKIYMGKNFQFQNDCHECYVKLKSKELNMLDYQQLYKFLKSLQYGKSKLKEVK